MFGNKSIYLDYAATTPLAEEVFSTMKPWMSGAHNPSSIHNSGKKAQEKLRECEADVKRLIAAQSADHVLFTSGGTESNNLAISGYLDQFESGTILTTGFEHSSVKKVLEAYEKKGFRLVYLPLTSGGVVNVVEAQELIDELDSCIFASIMMVQNEIGTVQPIKKLSKIIKSKFLDAVIHTDASQAPLFLSIDVQSLGVDLLTLCGHKIYGPTGVGALYVKSSTSLNSQLLGGLQQAGLRAGTEPIHLIIGFVYALVRADKKREAYKSRLTDLQDYFLSNTPDSVQLNGKRDSVLPLAINVSFDTEKSSEELVLLFNTHGIELSSKSACMGAHVQESYVLEACGLKRKNSIRFSFGKDTKKGDIKRVLAIINRL